MSSRPSAIVLIARMFGFNFVGCLLISLFWNTLSGMNMFPFAVVFWVAVVLTVIFVSIGWATVTVGSDVLLKDDQCVDCNVSMTWQHPACSVSRHFSIDALSTFWTCRRSFSRASMSASRSSMRHCTSAHEGMLPS